VGSPVLCDFGDFYQPRVLLLDGLEARSIKVKWRQKRLIECVWPDDWAGLEHAQAQDIVKVRVHLKMEHVAQWDVIRQSVLDKLQPHAYVINTIQPVVDYVQGKRTAIKQQAKTKDDTQYLTAFATRNGTDEKTQAVGKSILDLVT
jgi:hypothetical protein